MMRTDSSGFYKSISAFELEAARNVGFDKTFYEYPFRGPAEAYRIRHCLPVNFEAYGALILPWRAVDQSGHLLREEPFESISEVYAYVGIPAPKTLTLESWRRDFRVIEDMRVIPPLDRSALDRSSQEADAIFVRCHHNEIHNWKVERSIFLELSDPFVEMPCPSGSFGIFPRDAPWYIHNRDDGAILYLAAAAELVTQLERVCSDRFVRLTLDDYYW